MKAATGAVEISGEMEKLAQQASSIFWSLCKYQGRSLWADVYEDDERRVRVKGRYCDDNTKRNLVTNQLSPDDGCEPLRPGKKIVVGCCKPFGTFMHAPSARKNL
ncbi:hypothetical protein EYF80_015006 [Liparis tanakae]|uniref:Uncharacterized protein n=1 Tax=Liparis tanakae TaxID=230148 RepID=A0A4Z2I9P5_9TELE|nr:hypothetical protein EYF80_015006 [Liparis tanakae]